MSEAMIGVVGGSGLYGMDGLEVIEERTLDTPFGPPSDPYVIGDLDGRRVAFLARHGRGHRLAPSELNFRANIFGFKLLGVERLLSVSAVGSMQERYVPTHVVVPDQFFDRTRHRPDTFFGEGLVAHVSMADPICPQLMAVAMAAGEQAGATMHQGGTYLCMEGPQFSTRAESRIYRQWGVDVIGMTNLQEAKLAREAEICYATLAMVTDFDCWHDEHDDVTVETVIATLHQNAAMGQAIVREAVSALAGVERTCGCGDTLATALITAPEAVPAATRERLAPLIGRYPGFGGPPAENGGTPDGNTEAGDS